MRKVVISQCRQRRAERHATKQPRSNQRPAACGSHHVRNRFGEMQGAIGYNCVSGQAFFVAHTNGSRNKYSKQCNRNLRRRIVCAGPPRLCLARLANPNWHASHTAFAVGSTPRCPALRARRIITSVASVGVWALAIGSQWPVRSLAAADARWSLASVAPPRREVVVLPHDWTERSQRQPLSMPRRMALVQLVVLFVFPRHGFAA